MRKSVKRMTWRPLPQMPAPGHKTTILGKLREWFFPNAVQGAISVFILFCLFRALAPILDWAVFDAVWSNSGPRPCDVGSAGACWAVVAEKYRVMLFGAFPYSEHWRAVLACLSIIAATCVSAMPRFWSLRLVPLWMVASLLVSYLMLGGFGLRPLSTNDWGGLPLTLILFAGTLVLGFPLSLGLALGRQSHMPVFRHVSVGIIEIFRGLPLLVVLFTASLMLPLFLGDAVSIDKFVRAQVGMALFFAAYAAEVVRGGLQSLPKGQYEGAKALGLGYWPMMITVILPQALRAVAPALTNDVIRAFKNTSFVAVIGLFDFLGATRASLRDPDWAKFSTESYIFIMLVYFAICMTMSRYSLWLEKRIGKDRSGS